MSKWTKIVAGAVVALLIGIAAWASWVNKEPMYDGVRLREWVFGSPFVAAHIPERHKALMFFGTNSVPYVRAALRVRDSPSRKVLVWVAAKAPWLRIKVHTARTQHFVGLMALYEIQRLGAWGDAKGACAPELHAFTRDEVNLARMVEAVHETGIIPQH